MEFGSDPGTNGYSNNMDRDYDMKAHEHDGHNHSESTNDVGVTIGELGFSFGLGPVRNVQQISARLNPGSKKLELAFMGSGKGSAQGHTPAYYGEKQRQALREIQKANRVDITTHSTTQVTGLAGQGQRGFSHEAAAQSLEEVRRAIEFAADVARGGPVVVHTGEYNRAVSDANWNQSGKWAGKFEKHEKEAEHAEFMLIDTRTGDAVSQIKKSQTFFKPVWNSAKEGQEYYEGGHKKLAKKGEEIYIDYYKNKVKRSGRLPQYDQEKETFITKEYNWGDLVDEADKMTKEARKEFRKFSSMSQKERDRNDDFKNSIWRERIKRATNENDISIRPEEANLISEHESQRSNALGLSSQYSHDFMESVEKLKRLREARETMLNLEKGMSEEELNLKRKELRPLVPELGLSDDRDQRKLPSEIIERHIHEVKSRLDYNREMSTQQVTKAAELAERSRHVRSAHKYALEEAYDSYAQAGISAMRQSDKLREKGKLKRDIHVAMENLWPQQYGSHPDEMISLVNGSRKRMEKRLVQMGFNQEQAQKRSKSHISATLDVGHLNTWRKYWKGDHKKSIQANDKEFDKWAVEKVAQMTRAGVIGHIHLDDNYGYNDDHLAPGEGNAPIKGMIKALKENGYKGDMIVEPGADFSTGSHNGFSAMTKTWEHLNIPVHQGARGKGAARSGGWKDVQYGWFGQNQPAYFVAGHYIPSEDFKLWSGVPFD
jgi:sugar phosphate isomerase/epimerase